MQRCSGRAYALRLCSEVIGSSRGRASVLTPSVTCRLAERFMAHDPQRQSPVLSQIAEASEAHIASLPLHARRKLNRLAIQVSLSLLLTLSWYS